MTVALSTSAIVGGVVKSRAIVSSARPSVFERPVAVGASLTAATVTDLETAVDAPDPSLAVKVMVRGLVSGVSEVSV
ncbi:hypothetical protein AOPFMNJM_1517 [Methylobacterium jeotgali]|uniref:Uncharacterized protein n=1 Tax=Methylobacterium jeotgali TaxID=381630 RepID=A0ABQ4SWE6_9HYPH|nr:hypothetical protein AOPFMNJM_1517 [Methylobacterium jeotgali]